MRPMSFLNYVLRVFSKKKKKKKKKPSCSFPFNSTATEGAAPSSLSRSHIQPNAHPLAYLSSLGR
ncbi:hypothetical protein HanXRQr2_Chr16g0742231 [Helianthus annuus]|uniref:Uncharacterized protein n=1 Tax=Helianthus annuus TaxID=4232 RepID=A0A9K3GZR3_HELAN|nr:hypothetical protein HanXRQr2_Chr16g0742231 [Helianthus annuus]